MKGHVKSHWDFEKRTLEKRRQDQIKKHKCKICNKRFIRPGILKKHMKKHSNNNIINDNSDQTNIEIENVNDEIKNEELLKPDIGEKKIKKIYKYWQCNICFIQFRKVCIFIDYFYWLLLSLVLHALFRLFAIR